MDTILFFVYSNKYICANRIAGALRYAERRGWNIQVVERNNRRLDVKGVIDFWRPIGIIAECAGGIPELSRKTIGRIPLVYLALQDPKRRPAAAHLLLPGRVPRRCRTVLATP